MGSPREPMTTSALYRAYTVGVTAVLPFVAGGFLFSARGRRRFGERLGNWGSVESPDWWFHAASVGEVQGILPLLGELRGTHPSERVLLSSTSPTGLDRGEGFVADTRLLPFDAPVCVNRALARVKPKRFVVAETELWPTLLVSLMRRGIPCSVVNGRVSDYTVSAYKRMTPLFGPIMERFTHICVPSSAQRERYILLGGHPDRVHVTGHTKYDAEPRYTSGDTREVAKRDLLPENRRGLPTIVLGSLRPGEESVWFPVCAELLRSGVAFNLIVAPRHMEKVGYFADALAQAGIEANRVSAGCEIGTAPATLLDCMGRLEEAYAIGDLAFVGATLVDIGGHNPFEPAMYSVPVVVGPHISVIRDLVEEMRSRGGILEIATQADARLLIERLVSGEQGLQRVGGEGYKVWERHRGAAKRVVSLLSHE